MAGGEELDKFDPFNPSKLNKEEKIIETDQKTVSIEKPVMKPKIQKNRNKEIEKEKIEFVKADIKTELTDDDMKKLKKHILEYWFKPFDVNVKGIYVDILMSLNIDGNIVDASWVNRGDNEGNTNYIRSANTAIRALKDAEPLPLPPSKFEAWKNLILRFNNE